MRSAGEGLPGALHPDLDSALEDKSEKIKGNVSSKSSKRSGKENLQRKKKKKTRVVQLRKRRLRKKQKSSIFTKIVISCSC